MLTRAEHYHRAVVLLNAAAAAGRISLEREAVLVARAQVHATLALASEALFEQARRIEQDGGGSDA